MTCRDLLAGMSVLLLTSRLSAEPELIPPPRQIVVSSGPTELGRALERLGYAAVPIERPSTGHLIVQGSVDGKKLRFIIDTGSPMTWLDRTRVKHLKLEWDEQVVLGRDKNTMWDYTTSCELSALQIGGAVARRVRAYAFGATSTNMGLEAYGSEPVDGLIGADVLSAHGALIDFASNKLYLKRRGEPVSPEPGVYEVRGRQFALPLQWDPERLPTIERLRLFVSEDGGKTWMHHKDYKAGAHDMKYTAAHDGLYCFAVQFVYKDGTKEPPETDKFPPIMKVRVNTEREAHVKTEREVLKPDESPEGLRNSPSHLRRTLELLEWE
jgi:Aspartyl protease